MRDHFWAHGDGSCAHVYFDSAEILCLRGDRVSEGQECAVARQFGDKQRNFNGENLWARGYAVSTVGFELDKIKEYIAHQEKLDNEQEEGRF